MLTNFASHRVTSLIYNHGQKYWDKLTLLALLTSVKQAFSRECNQTCPLSHPSYSGRHVYRPLRAISLGFQHCIGSEKGGAQRILKRIAVRFQTPFKRLVFKAHKNKNKLTYGNAERCCSSSLYFTDKVHIKCYMDHAK